MTSTQHRRRGRNRRRTAVVGLVALTASTAVVGGTAYALNTNPPQGPGNIEIFPVRDMVGINGYGDYAGQQATITVKRGDREIGSAVGTVDATGFLEVNHPGGACWGDGTDLNVTPNIKGGDVVRVTFPDGQWDEATTTTVEVTDVTTDEAARALTFHGTFGGDVDMPNPADLVGDPGKFGVEIVNPDMRDGTSAVGERAIGWPGDPGEVTPGYAVDGTVGDGTFEVTFTFDQATDLALAEAGEHVGLGWQADLPAPAEGQQGLTLFEYGEAGGPGMGQCPAGPEELRPGKPADATAQGVAGGIDVAWGEAQTAPESPAVNGYIARAVDGEGNEVGKRLGAGGRSASLTGLTDGEIYSVEVSARSEAGESYPPVVMTVKAGQHVAAEVTPEVVGAEATDGVYPPLMGAGQGVVFTPNNGLVGGVRVYYTTDGSTPSTSSKVWQEGISNPIKIARTTTLRWLAQDAGNIPGTAGTREFVIEQSTAAAPVISAATAKDGAADLTFGLVEGATAYEVRVFEGAGTTPVAEQEVTATPAEGATTITHEVTGLTNGTEYTFSVAALVVGVWTADSERSQPVTPVELPAADAGADQSTFRGRTVTLDGSASKGAESFAWAQVAGTGDPTVTLTGGDTGKPTFTFPTIPAPGVPAADATLEFELTITAAGGGTFTDTVVVTAQADSITADRNRFRAGRELRVSGTGTQEGAVLYFRDAGRVGANNNVANAPVLTTATVTNGAWALPNNPNLGPASNRYHVTSSHGYVGTIQLTR